MEVNDFEILLINVSFYCMLWKMDFFLLQIKKK